MSAHFDWAGLERQDGLRLTGTDNLFYRALRNRSTNNK
jgi:hypothetical protein